MSSEEIIFLCVITLTSIFGSSFLIRDILSGKTRLNLVTWFFWALAPLVGVFFQVKAGAGLSALPVFFAGFFPVVIFILALSKHRSYWKISKFDIFCGIFSLLALITYVLTRRTDISIIFAILADTLAAVPTLIKSWKFPETETTIGYVPGIFNNALGLFMIKNWTFSIYSLNIYFIVLNITLVTFLLRKKIFKS